MGTLLVNQIKKQAASFIQEKYRTVRLVLTDITHAELLAEEATNSDPVGPDAKTMTTITEASYLIDDYWRIVDVLHKRLYALDPKQWRQSYKALLLLDFLLTHGPEDFAEEFRCDSDVIEEIGRFKFVDEKGFDWGILMHKKSERILDLLTGGRTLKEARLKALRITKEIQGFGNCTSTSSPSSSTPSSSSSSSGSSSRTSFGSYSTGSTTWNDIDHDLMNTRKETLGSYALGGIYDKDDDEDNDNDRDEKPTTFRQNDENPEGQHLWDYGAIQEKGSLLNSEGEGEEYAGKDGFMTGICSKLVGISPTIKHTNLKKATFRNYSDLGRPTKKKTFNRQFSAHN